MESDLNWDKQEPILLKKAVSGLVETDALLDEES